MDQDSIDRIRSASFPLARKGYEQSEVDRFLSRLADWLESGVADDSPPEHVRKELERIGAETAKILTDAHDVAEGIRNEANRYAAGMRSEADAYSERVRIEADSYARETTDEADAYMARHRNDADSYAQETRAAADQQVEQARSEGEAQAEQARLEADRYAQQVRSEADRYAEEARANADRQAAAARREAEESAEALVEEGNKRRAETEKVISDLESRRDAVLEEMQRLSSELTGTASSHKTGESDAVPEDEQRGEPQTAPDAARP